ncbi:hypothetical protein [Peptostreptococcus stomatis]|uniref:hypothetical protein n=1 Tax=Peptostreptococcus stomatis TaxID=341694 RepID=UPI003FA03451
MAKKKVYFYKVSAQIKGNIFAYDLIGEEISKIVEKNGVKNGKYGEEIITLNLSKNPNKDSICLDVVKSNQRFIFGRMCKEKDYTELLKRKLENYEAETPLGQEEENVALQVISYFMYDIEKAILCFSKSQGGPGYEAFMNIFEKYKKEMIVSINPIPNKNAIDLIYYDKGTDLLNLVLEIPNPNAEFIEKVLMKGANVSETEKAVLSSLTQNTKRAVIKLCNDERKHLENNPKNARKIIDFLKNNKQKYNKTILNGKSMNISSQDFDLNAEYYSYSIDVKYEKVSKGKRIRLSLDKIDDSYLQALEDTYYNVHKDTILGLVNRMD